MFGDLRTYIQNLTAGRLTSGNWQNNRGTADGAIYTEEWITALAIEGLVYGANGGAVTTPIATPATSAINILRPQFWVLVPDGTAIIPLRAAVQVETSGATTQGEIAVAMCQNFVGNGTSSAATAGPISLNSAVPASSLCTVRQLATADVTAPTNPLELDRFSFAADADNLMYGWEGKDQSVPPILRGPASFLIYIGGNTVNFFAQVQWAEVTEASVS